MNLSKSLRRDILSIASRKLKEIIYGEPEPLYARSYSQLGEDIIIDYALRRLAPAGKVAYLDLGACHPTRFNNTYSLYLKGCRGVCVEPNPALAPSYKKWRPEDTLVQAGVGTEASDGVEFYILTADMLSTFSRDEAQRICRYGNQKIERVIKVPLVTVETILSRYFTECPHFVSIDVESLDLAILQSIDFTRYCPLLFCVETITYTEDKTEEKIPGITEFMKSKGYFPLADTHINTIYAEAIAWRRK